MLNFSSIDAEMPKTRKDKLTFKEYLEVGLLVAVLTASASVLYGWYLDIASTHPGSFEYVRKGEDLLDNGNFKGAIKYFEKAYDSSPNNSIITAKLRNSYLYYASYLQGSGEYDKSINCLKRAYTIMPGPSSAGELSLGYAKKAIKSLDNYDIDKARPDFYYALEAAAPYASSSRNLGAFLFNESIKRYKSGDNESAIYMLKESSLAYKNVFVFELLGDIYYNEMELDKARFYFGKGFSHDRSNKRVRGKLKKSIIDLRSAKNRRSLVSPHFDIRYQKDLPVDTNIVKGLFEKAYFDIGEDLKYFPASKTGVILYSQKDFDRIFSMSRGTRAIYDGNIKIPIPGETITERELAEYIYHEYTHAIVSAKTDNNCPVWLSEGIAVWESSKYAGTPMPLKTAWMPKDATFTVKTLYDCFGTNNRTDNMIMRDYALSYGAVRFIIDSWGISGLCGILDRIKIGRHFTNAIDEEFLISEKDFEKRWEIYCLKRTD